MRRKDRETDSEQTIKLLKEGEYGVLATVDAEGQPYATPLSYVCTNNLIYFHCATEGHKLNNLKSQQTSFLLCCWQNRCYTGKVHHKL